LKDPPTGNTVEQLKKKVGTPGDYKMTSGQDTTKKG
jgi:hypothetical protein